ncbi:MAG TPA: hypothetical protein VEX86_12315 [Longimicrobium sp.]|nr:hypothetical protein [Longimicrobium sp.]
MADTVETAVREVVDRAGRTWVAVPAESKVAHLKQGAVLAFRPGDEPGAEPIRTNVEFNSAAAADFAIRTMSEKEIGRRLDWAKTDAGIP